MEDMVEIHRSIGELAGRWREERGERLARRSLDQRDFDAIAATGFWAAVLPVENGGPFAGVESSTRDLCVALRTLAGGDPSVALVAAMHPAVIGYWIATSADTDDWRSQRAAVVQSAVDGRQWGTITSEPGSGGDIARTRTVAVPDGTVDIGLPGRGYRLSGQKHFGSGSGVADYMVTTAVAEGEEGPAVFVLDTTDRSWDGSTGTTLIAEWDGMGMKATQSHAMALDGAPAVRLAYDGPLEDVVANTAAFIGCLFTSVVVGVVDEAIATARPRIAAQAEEMRAYEQVEWTRAETGHWLMVQAHEGALRAVESGDRGAALHAALRAKQAGAELAEQVLLRTSRVLGGGSFSQRSPFAHWFEDVRALGFLRPPWGLAYDALFATSLG